MMASMAFNRHKARAGMSARAMGIGLVLMGIFVGCTSDDDASQMFERSEVPAAASQTTSGSASVTTVVASTPDPPPATTVPTRAPFSDHFQQVLRPGSARWESQYVDPGAVISVDGRLHMFYNGIHDWPANAAVGHAVSSDGITWERLVDQPLMSAIDVPWVGVSMFASDAVVLDDGTWVIYFHATERINSPAGSTIGIVTAPGPDGPWTFGAGPVLEPGSPGSWDDIGVLNPSVVSFDGRWLMFYDAQSGDERAWGVRKIGVARSDDGLVWDKQARPVLLASGDGWRSVRVYDPNVVVDGDRLVMTFVASIDDPNRGILEFYVGLATSGDGSDWLVLEEPILDVRQQGLGAIFITSMERLDQGFRLLFDSRATDLTTRVWVLGHDGPLTMDPG